MSYKGKPIASKVGYTVNAEGDWFDDIVQKVAKDITLQQTNSLLNQLNSAIVGTVGEAIADILNDIRNYLYAVTEGMVTFPYRLDIDGSTVPKTGTEDILTPSSGKKLNVKGVFMSTTSAAGTVEVRFKNTGKTLFSLQIKYDNKYSVNWINLTGDTDEPLEVSWDNFDTPSVLVLLVNYVEV